MDRAIKVMLRNGVIHSDLHFNNVFISGPSKTPSVQILDFGFASIVPPLMKKKIVKLLDNGGSVQDVFTNTGLKQMIDALKIEYSHYHPNANSLSYLQKLRNLYAKRGLRSHAVTKRSPSSVLNK